VTPGVIIQLYVVHHCRNPYVLSFVLSAPRCNPPAVQPTRRFHRHPSSPRPWCPLPSKAQMISNPLPLLHYSPVTWRLFSNLDPTKRVHSPRITDYSRIFLRNGVRMSRSAAFVKMTMPEMDWGPRQIQAPMGPRSINKSLRRRPLTGSGISHASWPTSGYVPAPCVPWTRLKFCFCNLVAGAVSNGVYSLTAEGPDPTVTVDNQLLAIVKLQISVSRVRSLDIKVAQCI
jgi:hypothetical protein